MGHMTSVYSKLLYSVTVLSAAFVFSVWPAPSSAASDDSATITVGIYSPPRQLDPAKQTTGEEWVFSYLIHDNLTDLNKNMEVQPRLAKSWNSSADLTRWTFELREGVKFHNGDPLVADDVVVTFDRILNTSGESPGRSGLSMVKDVKAQGSHTVVFTLEYSYGEFPHILANHWYNIVSRKTLDTLSTHPIGTGPFKLQEYTVGEKAVFVKNSHYWQEGIPKAQRLVFRILPEPIVGITSLENGEIDLLFQLPLGHVSRLKQNPNITVDLVPTVGFDMIVMNTEHPPFDNNKVRLALKYATNKQELVEAALFDLGTATITPVTHIPSVANPSLQDIPQDYAKAKSLLAEAGFSEGLNETMYVPEGRPTRKSLGIALQQMWKPAGVNLTLETVPWDKFVADIEFKAALYTDGFRGFPTVDAAIYPFLHSKGSWNFAHWNNPKMDELLDNARRTGDAEERRALYSKIQKLARDKGAIIFPYVLQNADAYSKNLNGFQTSPFIRLELGQAYKTAN